MDDAGGKCQTELALLDEVTDLPQDIPCEIPLAAFGIDVRRPRPMDLANAVLDRYGELFHVNPTVSGVTLQEANRDPKMPRDREFYYEFGQTFEDVDVWGSMLRIHISPRKRAVTYIGNHLIPDIQIDVRPEISLDDARETAVQIARDSLETTSSQLVVFPGESWLLEDAASPVLSWMLNVTTTSEGSRLLFIDADTGELLVELP